MKYKYAPRGVCAKEISFDYDGEKISDLAFHGGCHGNLKAIGKLLDGSTPEYIVDKLKGNTCGSRPTSCTDQLARAMEALMADELKPSA